MGAKASKFSLEDIKLTGTFELEYTYPQPFDRQWNVIPVMGFKFEREQGHNSLFLAPYVKYALDKWSIGPEILIPIYSTEPKFMKALLKTELKFPY